MDEHSRLGEITICPYLFYETLFSPTLSSTYIPFGC